MHALLDNVIEGSGGAGKAGGAGSGATEAPNTLRSKAKARFVELLSEGEILGLVDGAKSIILNKIALENADGSKNYQGFSWDLRTGTSDQAHLEGFPSVTSEQQVGLRVKSTQPVVYRTQSDTLDAVRVTLQIPALTHLDKKTGSLEGYNVTIKIDIKSLAGGGGSWITKVNKDYISGKNTAPYERAYRIGLSGTGPWLVRMTRLSADDDNDSTIQSTTVFSHITEIQDHKIMYSDSAVIGVEIDADQFGNGVADREYDLYGIKMQYPSNYNPATRVYTGFWDGTWSYGYCNNPAWLFRWIAIHQRYGAMVPDALIDKWGLFELSKYCDVMVPDGFGGYEPRFQFNGELADQEEAYKALQRIASMMRAIVFYSSGAVIVRQDAPMAPEQKIYTPANVIGKFNYASTALSVRHNACVVSWTNPDIGYETDYEVYEDRASILKFGYNQLEIKATGTTSRGQAYRMAKWAILTEQLQKDTVDFDAGFDSAQVLPGDIIEIADPHKATADFGGRLMQPGTANIVKEARISQWTLNAASRPSGYMPGPWGARNMRALQSTSSTGAHTTEYEQTAALTAGATYTYSFFARPSTTSLVYGRVKSSAVTNINASFDLGRELVLFMSNGVTKAKVVKWSDGLYRCSITFVAPTGFTPSLVVGIDRPAKTTLTSTNVNSYAGTNTDIAFFGCPQLELGTEATYPFPPQPNGTTSVMLDRDIEYSGSTSPELHISLIDGPLDNKPGLDNTDRLAARKITYFSSGVTSYQPETQIITLSSSLTAGGNDKKTPLVWIFSKAQIAPKPYKVITIKENDNKSFSINAIEYSTEKFVKLDEGFIITYDANRSFSNLPKTSYCAPPVIPLKVEPSSQLVNGNMQQSIVISWGASPDQFLRGYVVTYKRNDDNWVTLPMVYENFVEVRDVLNGGYIFSVRAVNKFGVASDELTQGLNLNENTVAGKGVIVNLYTDTGGFVFTDKDIRLFWISNSLSGDVKTPAFTASVNHGAGAGTSSNSDGYLVTGGTQTISTGAAAVDLTNLSAPKVTLSGTWRFGDQLTVTIGMNEFTTEYSNSDTLTTLSERIKSLIDADPRYIAARSGQVITVTFVDGATNASNLESSNDPLFKRYVMNVRDSLTNALKRTEYTNQPQYTYTYAKNAMDFGGIAQRSVKFELSVEDIFDNVSGTKTLIVTNPAPVPTPVIIEKTPYTVHLRFTPPNDPDYQGIVVYMSTDAGFSANEGNKVYQDRGNPTIPVQPGATYYIRYGFYDAFGIFGISLSPATAVEIPAIVLDDFDFTELQRQIDLNAEAIIADVATNANLRNIFDFRTIIQGTNTGVATFAKSFYDTQQGINSATSQFLSLLGANVDGNNAIQINIDTVRVRKVDDTGNPLDDYELLSQRFSNIAINIANQRSEINRLDEVFHNADGTVVRAVLELDNAGYISGQYNTNDGTVSSTVFRVDAFGIVSSDGSSQLFTPFSVVGNKVKMTNVEVDTFSIGGIDSSALAVNAVSKKAYWIASSLGGGAEVLPSNSFGDFGLSGDKATVGLPDVPEGGEVSIRMYINAQRTGGDNDRVSFRLKRVAPNGSVTYLETVPFGLTSVPSVMPWEWIDLDIDQDGLYIYTLQGNRTDGVGTYFAGKLIGDVAKR